jgi:hypothetical protein
MQKFLFHITLLSSCISLQAQDTVINNGSLQVHTGASISVFGTIINNSGASLINNGDLYAHRNLTNNETSMAIGSGTLYLNGSVAQVVNGSQPFRTNHFVSNNASGITLNNNIRVSGTHTFSSGIITTSATPNYLVYESGSSYSGDGDSRHVHGWVKKFGASDFVFPVGNGTVERTVALTSLSASSEFNARYFSATPPNNNSTQIPVRDIDDWEYWPITKSSGGTAIVTLNWDFSKIYFPNWIIPDILVTGSNGSMWTDNGGAGTASGNVTTTGTVTSSAQSSFNLFTFGSRSWILPVTLTDFTAFRKDEYSLIQWNTQKEINLDHYIVERSDNGTAFYGIATLKARNSGNAEHYEAIDKAPIKKIAYYRLRLVDIDGKESYSRIVVVNVNNNADLLLLTNPVRNKITLVATQQLSGEFRYQLTAINGQLAQEGTVNVLRGAQHQINLNPTIKAGSYVLVVTNQMQTFQYKVLVL